MRKHLRERGEICVGNDGWRRKGLAPVGDDVLRITSAAFDAHHPVAETPTGDSFTDRRDHSGELEAGDLELARHGVSVAALALQHIGTVHRRVADLDE